jgi:hypothetical protein
MPESRIPPCLFFAADVPRYGVLNADALLYFILVGEPIVVSAPKPVDFITDFVIEFF